MNIIMIAASILTLYAVLSGQFWLIGFSVILFEVGSGFLGSTLEMLSSWGDDHE